VHHLPPVYQNAERAPGNLMLHRSRAKLTTALPFSPNITVYAHLVCPSYPPLRC
jgi:hypothetical protein